MMNELDLTAVNAIAIVPIIIALVQMIKMAMPGDRLNKWSPIISMGFGLLAAFIFNTDKMEIEQVIMSGIVYGLSASGLYSGIKTTAHSIKDDNDNNGTKGL